MEDRVSDYINATGSAIVAGGITAVASILALSGVYARWPQVVPGCMPPAEIVLAAPAFGILGAGAAIAHSLYQARRIHEAIRAAGICGGIIVLILSLHFALLVSSSLTRAYPINPAEPFAEILPVYLLLGAPAALLLRWRFRLSRELRQTLTSTR